MARRMKHDSSPAKKTVRVREEQEDIDMLSKLPHEIVESIMCLLPMEEAVGTRMICRRWEKLWMNTVRFTHRLDLDFSRWYDVSEKTTSSIVNWVSQVMKLHDHGQTLEDLTIKACNLNSDHSDHIDRWIEFAAQKRVKKLCLDFNIENLTSPTGQPYSVLNNFPSLYWLRDLHMNRIQVTKKVIDRLFSKSPFLERFSLIDSPCLHKLVIDSNSAPNLKYLLVKSCKNLRHLGISTPILNTIDIGDLPCLRHCFLSTPNLSKATLKENFMFHYYMHLLGQLKSLTSELTWKQVSHPSWHQIPTMTQLEHLDLILFNVPASRCSSFLMAAPFLHTFKLNHINCFDPCPDINLKRMEKHILKKLKENLTYSHQYLKVVELLNFSDCQVEFLLHLLKIAVSLEKLIIQLCRTIQPRKGKICTDSYQDNQYRAELSLKCAQLLKIMRPNIDLVIN